MAMLAIPLSPDISRLFREIEIETDIHRDPSDHITLFCLGDDIEINQILKIIPVVYDITSETQPFEVTSSKISYFPKGDHGYPMIVQIKSPELEAIHSKIKRGLDSKKIKYDKTFTEYNPHVTLGWARKRPQKLKFDKVKWAISQIGLYGGDEVDSKIYVNFPFTLGISKIEKINSFANSFAKFSSM